MHDSVALLWNKISREKHTTYQIYVNGEKADHIQETDYTLEGLLPNRLYDIYIEAEDSAGMILSRSELLHIQTKNQPKVFNVSDYGAYGDGETLNTVAIQNTIDDCCEDGCVYIPKGVYRTGALYLKSNMILYLESGAILLGSNSISDFPIMKYRFEGLETHCYASLINVRTEGGQRLKNITLAGYGTIDANGSTLRKQELMELKGKPGRAVCIRNTDYLYMKGITVRQSPAWCVHFIYCNHVSINQLKVYTKEDIDGNRYEGISNGDGIDPDSSSNVYIFRSKIASQDDCIAIKSGRDEEGRNVGISSENYRITNCSFISGFGVAVGSEMSGSIRNVLVQDCTFENAYSVGSIKAPRGRGGVVENIVYEDIQFANMSTEHEDCEWFRGAIYIDNYYSHVQFDVNRKELNSAGTPVIRNIIFRNIELETVAGNAIYMVGLPESPLERISLIDVRARGKYGMVAQNIRNLILDNVKVKSVEETNFIFHNVR